MSDAQVHKLRQMVVMILPRQVSIMRQDYEYTTFIYHMENLELQQNRLIQKEFSMGLLCMGILYYI